MPLALQAKILRLLQEQSFERVGGNETIRTDVRLIAATHRDLKAWSAEGKFRPDLYYRLGVFTIHLPPCANGATTCRCWCSTTCGASAANLDARFAKSTPETLERLRHYPWPGNIRELQSVLKQALLQASGTILLPAFLPELSGSPSESDPAVPPGQTSIWKRSFANGSARYPGSLRGHAPPCGPAFAALVMEYTGGESTPGGPHAGNRPANPAPETSRPGAACHALC